MKYLCMVFLDEKNLAALSKSELQDLNDESLGYDETLRTSGHFVAAQALQSVQNAATIRVRDGKITVTDGPFAETNEHIGGFILIEARDLNEAIQVASKIPVLRLGAVEVFRTEKVRGKQFPLPHRAFCSACLPRLRDGGVRASKSLPICPSR
jgi:hypothetical protein